jgi:hypothetical protein
MKQYIKTQCVCEICKEMCVRRPCWPSPDEVVKLIEAGYGDRLMLDYWCADPDINIIAPACIGSERSRAPSFRFTRCTFIGALGLCELHDIGLKPIEGRLTHHDGDLKDLHYDVAMLWESDEGREVVQKWRDEFYDN